VALARPSPLAPPAGTQAPTPWQLAHLKSEKPRLAGPFSVERTGIDPVTSGLQRRLRADLDATRRDEPSVHAAPAQPDNTAHDRAS